MVKRGEKAGVRMLEGSFWVGKRNVRSVCVDVNDKEGERGSTGNHYRLVNIYEDLGTDEGC